MKKEDKVIKGAEEEVSFAAFVSGRKFRFGDWFSEKLIRTIAFMSIAFVVLIFVFVFRETMPLFRDQTPPEQTHGSIDKSSTSLTPEIYDPSAEEMPADELKPESYTTEGTDEETLKPETYGDVVAPINEPADDKKDNNHGGSENRKAISTLLSADWQPVSDNPRYGLIPLFLGTLKITLIAILFAAPIAILAAVYTAIFAPPRIREVLKPALELLAGFPSVVIGFFALMVLASFFSKSIRLFRKAECICGRSCHGTGSNSCNLYPYRRCPFCSTSYLSGSKSGPWCKSSADSFFGNSSDSIAGDICGGVAGNWQGIRRDNDCTDGYR